MVAARGVVELRIAKRQGTLVDFVGDNHPTSLPSLALTYVFTPIEGGRNATAYFNWQPAAAWAQGEAILTPAFDRANRRLIGMLTAQAQST